MQEYYARSSERNILRHGQHKYIDKYRSKKTGKWVYIYDSSTLRGKIEDAIGLTSKKNYEYFSQQLSGGTGLARRSQQAEKYIKEKNAQATFEESKNSKEAKRVAQKVSKELNDKRLAADIKRDYESKLNAETEKKTYNSKAYAAAKNTISEYNHASRMYAEHAGDYHKSLIGTVDQLIRSSSNAIESGKRFIDSLFSKGVDTKKAKKINNHLYIE